MIDWGVNYITYSLYDLARQPFIYETYMVDLGIDYITCKVVCMAMMVNSQLGTEMISLGRLFCVNHKWWTKAWIAQHARYSQLGYSGELTKLSGKG